ncbi:uncharacterized protein LOC143877034 isoform X2 [Tasmannia lanceolata]
MDLNLYLGLPRSPIRRGSDLGSDLALGSILLSGEEINVSREMPGFIEALDSHAPYSPTHASYTPNQPLGTTENLHIEHNLVSPEIQTSNEPLVRDGSSDLEYSPYSPSLPSYVPASAAGQTSIEPLGQDINTLSEYDPYSPSYAPVTPIVQDSSEPIVEEGTNHAVYVPYSPSYAPVSPLVQPNEPFVLQDIDSHVPDSTSYVPVPATSQLQVRDNHSIGQNSPSSVAFRPYRPNVQTSESLMPDSASQQELLQYPEVRFRRLIESNRRWPIRRFRSTVHFRAEHDFTTPSSRRDPVFQDIMASERSVETSGAHKVSAEGLVNRDVEEEVKEKTSGPANFECNVCLDVANEPVVTSCGHLFCWPCLYQWLHMHSDYKECPVCKGEVTESNITPIYGRGSSEAMVEKKGGDSSLKVPPRPRGCRFESLRHGLRRPLSRRRLGEGITSRGHVIDEELRSANGFEGQEPSLRGIFSDAGMLTRLRAARRLLRQGSSENGVNVGASGSSRNTTAVAFAHASNSQIGNSHVEELHEIPGSSSFLHDGIDVWHRMATDRLASLTGGEFERMSNNGNQYGTSTSVNPQNPNTLHGQGSRGATPAADQASASSTMAVIQGDVGVLNVTDETNAAGSSRSPRRRRRNGTSGSLDVDGGVHHARKRRRMN